VLFHIKKNKESAMSDMVLKEEMIKRIRRAVEDRGVWLALLYKEFIKHYPQDQVETICRKAIFHYGEMKAKADVDPFEAKDWVIRHKEKGSAEIFDSTIDYNYEYATQYMHVCPLLDGWKKMDLSQEELELFCDITMEGDRGRAASHDGIRMVLGDTLAFRGCNFCDLKIVNDKQAVEKEKKSE
jgi:hypothetical protein